jgi:hypothetical protein
MKTDPIIIAGHSFRLATPDDAHLPYLSFSIMEAILTCPKWGLIRYRDRKYFKASYRALALEAGSAMHEVFAALRLWQVLRLQKLPRHFKYHAERIFGPERAESCFHPKKDPRDEALGFCFEILNSGEFYDDPRDDIRTIANMEETTIRYVEEMMKVMDTNPIWIAGGPTEPVGIELAFDMVIDERLRYIGTIDGIVHRLRTDVFRNEENKTSSRIDSPFRDAFRVKFQPTGYTIPARLITGHPVEETKIIAIKVKQTRSHEDFQSFIEERSTDDQFEDFLRGLFFTQQLCDQYAGNFLDAPMFTHSCNRYFRACGFIDLCSASREDQQLMYSSMERTPYSPSERSILGDDR